MADYVYVVTGTPISCSDMENNKIPLFDTGICFEDEEAAVAHLIKGVRLKSDEMLLVYKCFKSNPKLKIEQNSVSRRNVHIVEIQRIKSEDQSEEKITRVELISRPVTFVPEPLFQAPSTIDELKRNLEVYKKYRTTPERREIQYLKKFGIFNGGYSLDDKKKVVDKLLNITNESTEITLSKRELRILHNGILGKACKNFEKSLIKVNPEKELLFGCIPNPFAF